MKQILFLLFFACINVSSFSQPEILKNITDSSDKWVITSVSNMKGNLGRLDLNFPENADWSVDIKTRQNKFIINRGKKNSQHFYDLAPGHYNFKVNTVTIENVPIEKGKITRLKTGVLVVNSAGHWELRSESKQKFFTSGNKPANKVLPVGKYQLKEGGNNYRLIDITDMPVDIPGTLYGETYIMVPITGQGRLATRFPLTSTSAFFTINTTLRIYTNETDFVFECVGGSFQCQATYPLPDGNYKIHFGFRSEATASGVKYKVIPNIPILKGYETRLKVGYISHSAPGIYQFYDETNQDVLMKYSSQGFGRYPIPIGKYWVELLNVGKYQFEIKDEKVSGLNPEDSAISAGLKWTINPILKNSIQPEIKSGRLNTFFPGAEKQVMYVRIPKPDGSGYKYMGLDTLESIDLLPGSYLVGLNSATLELPIQSGKETMIKSGYLIIDSLAGAWKIRSETGGFISRGDGDIVIVLPIGFYTLEAGQLRYLIKINEGGRLIYRWQ